MCVCASYSSSGPCAAGAGPTRGGGSRRCRAYGARTLQRPPMPDTGRMHFRRERVRIETARHEIEGTLQLPNEGFRSRTTDFLNAQGDDFLALTDAEVTLARRRARARSSHEYLALAARHVVLVVELGSVETSASRARASRTQRRRHPPDGLFDELRRRPDVEAREARARRRRSRARATSATRPRSRNTAAGSSPRPSARQSSHARKLACAGTTPDARVPAAAPAARAGWPRRASVSSSHASPSRKRRLGRDRARGSPRGQCSVLGSARRRLADDERRASAPRG